MSGLQIPANSVWSSMNYTPPRGPCNFKNGIMSGTCTCLRFMLHPVKAATSFECDGCSHHASYHNLENPAEDAVLQKWSAQNTAVAVAPGQRGSTAAQKSKRKRISERANDEGIVVTDLTSEEEAYSRTASRSGMR